MVRIGKFTKSLLEGKTQRQAAMDAGYSPGCADPRGHDMAKDPEVISLMQKSMQKNGLGPDRYCKELNKGLKKSKTGSHVDYLDRLGAINGIRMKEDDIKPVNQTLIINRIEQSREEGLSK